MKQLGCILIFAALLSSCGSTSNGPIVPNTDIDSTYENNISTLYGYGSKVENMKASNIIWKDSLGNLHSLDEVTANGEVILLNFWATWCPPCNAELPDLKAVADSMTQYGVRVIGVSLDYGSSILDFVRFDVDHFQIPYQIVIDPKQITYLNYGGDGTYPRTYMIDRNGFIRYILPGQRYKSELIQWIKTLL